MPRTQAKVRTDAPGQATDQELLEGIRQGSESAFTALYDRYFGRIYAFAQTRLRSHSDAEEIVQDTFTAVFRSVDSYSGQSSLLSWIYGIARNTINSHIRKRLAEERRVDRADPDALRPSHSLATCSPEEQIHMSEFTGSIREFFDESAGWQAEVFALRHMENLSIPEICDRTGRSADAVRSSLYRVKRHITESAAQG